MPPFLEVDDIYVSYGRAPALKGVSLSVNRGEMVCLLGPNGAGKSTALAAIAGGLTPAGGSIRFEGVELVGRAPELISRRGIALVPEGRHVFATLTVEENLQIGTYSRADRTDAGRDIEAMLDLFPRLRERRRAHAGMLSGGEQQMLVIARALLTRPRLLMVDEPSLGLAPKIVDQVYETLLALRASQGLTLLINEQNSHRVLKHADRIYVIRDGHIQLEGAAAALADGDAVKSAYFGFKPGTVKAEAIL
jgi:branched-chain amino acid transport system ATP-binding protein